MNMLGRLLSQSKRPRGWFGRVLVRGMNIGHHRLTRWGGLCPTASCRLVTAPVDHVILPFVLKQVRVEHPARSDGLAVATDHDTP